MTVLDETDAETTDEAHRAAARPRTVHRGLRIRGVRIPSVAKTAFVFFAVGYVAILGTLVVVWNVMQWVGFIADIEDLLTTSLGLDAVRIAGADLLGLAVVGFGIIAIIGFGLTVLAAAIYNATGKIFGGVHVDTTLTRRRRPIARRRRSRRTA